MPADSNLLALVKLLADTQPEIVEAARAKFVELGASVVPFLEKVASEHEDPKVRVEARGILERIRLEEVSRQWKTLSALPDGKINLEKGAFLLAKVSYPDLDPRPYQERLDALADRIRSSLKAAKTPQERLLVVNRSLFKEEGYRGNWNDYFDPQNSYLNRVLDRRLGIPISLSVLYLLVAERLKIPVKGAGIPGHFMVRYKDREAELYVDVFNEGRFLTRPECVQFIVESGYPYQPEFLEGVGPREILARMLRNLILIYVDRHERTLERTLTQFLQDLYPEIKPAKAEEEEGWDLPE